MRIHVIVTGILATASQAFAQANVCTNGPGVPFGIRGYSCTSCSVLRIDDAVSYVFGTEPTVTEAADSSVAGSAMRSAFRVGDVITTMNGKPITTREGAQDFATPRPGRNAIGLRRWDGTTLWNAVLHVNVRDDCQPATPYSLEIRRLDGRAIKPPPLGGKPPYALAKDPQADSGKPPYAMASRASVERFEASVRPPAAPFDSTSRAGFAVSCRPSCSKITDKQGATFWKHDGFPAVVAVRSGSPASDSGLMVGDLITEVDGISITDQAGSRKLQTFASLPAPTPDCFKCEVPVMKLSVIRNGRRQEMMLVLRDASTWRPHAPPR